MKRVSILSAVLLCAAAVTSGFGQPIEGRSDISPDALGALKGTSWVDIGIGRTLQHLSAAELSRLRRCDRIAMYFESWQPYYLDQVFLTGLSMRDTFHRADFTRPQGRKVISLYRLENSPTPEETLYLSADGIGLTRITPPAIPHSYVRCQSQPEKRGK